MAASSAAVRAQQNEPTRRVGILIPYAEGDAEGGEVIAALRRGLEDLGWVQGRNVQLDIRWAAGDPGKARDLARELIGTAPDVIVPSSNLVTTIMVQEDAHHTYRIYSRRRSGRQRLRCKYGATWR
jgi:putative ABC transport system substrate-binding protein